MVDLQPAYGLRLPEGTSAKATFGARTILKSGHGLDFVPDRCDGKGDASKGFKAFVDKMARHFNKLAAQHKFNTGKEERHRLDDGAYHAEADTSASYGYVYIIAWEE